MTVKINYKLTKVWYEILVIEFKLHIFKKITKRVLGGIRIAKFDGEIYF